MTTLSFIVMTSFVAGRLENLKEVVKNWGGIHLP